MGEHSLNPAMAADKHSGGNVSASRALTYLWFPSRFHRPRLVQKVHAEPTLGPKGRSATCVSSTCGNNAEWDVRLWDCRRNCIKPQTHYKILVMFKLLSNARTHHWLYSKQTQQNSTTCSLQMIKKMAARKLCFYLYAGHTGSESHSLSSYSVPGHSWPPLADLWMIVRYRDCVATVALSVKHEIQPPLKGESRRTVSIH